MKKLVYGSKVVPWRCKVHKNMRLGTRKSPPEQDSQRTYGENIPTYSFGNLSLNTDNPQDITSPRLKLYDPKFIVPKSILDNDMPGTIYVYSIKTPAEYPGNPVYYYKIGNAIDVKAAGLSHLNLCSKFRELRFKKHYPSITRLHSYPTDHLYTLMHQVHGNLVKNEFEVLGTKKSATCMGCYGSHMEWYSITKEKGDSLKPAKKPNALYPGWNFIHSLIVQLNNNRIPS
ncbi:hypothetical protein DSO57_1000444 [Entomophthora muscae]|uniref:Uncharacterized protein n=1 Tax=Entomophthora muscae TaxID=34485 RepID=A0ACC2UKD5_9FUNG|nr:hypothetical protein DSO57_1000444 [Entomophthora muscae]